MSEEDNDDAVLAADEGVDAGAEGSAEVELSELDQLTAERDKLKDQLLRTAADFDNFRKRSRKEVEQADLRGGEKMLRELLPVIDNLERAVASADQATDTAAVLEGVQMVLKLFEDTASKVGLEKVPSVGERFDPNVHDAFQQVETDEHPPGTVITEYQPGYRLKEKLLRPAMVVVARKPVEPVEPDEPEGDVIEAEAEAVDAGEAN